MDLHRIGTELPFRLARPLRARSFQTVLSMGMLHLFDAIDPLLAGFQRALQSDGQLFLSSLVRNNRLGDRYMRFLHRAGELAAPRSSEESERALNRGCEACGAFSVSGNMAYATCRAA